MQAIVQLLVKDVKVYIRHNYIFLLMSIIFVALHFQKDITIVLVQHFREICTIFINYTYIVVYIITYMFYFIELFDLIHFDT